MGNKMDTGRQVRIDQIISLYQPYVRAEQTAKLGIKYSKVNR